MVSLIAGMTVFGFNSFVLGVLVAEGATPWKAWMTLGVCVAIIYQVCCDVNQRIKNRS